MANSFEVGDVTAFFTREALACHEILDEMGVPRGTQGGPYSLSQRVDELRKMIVKLNVAVTKFNRTHGDSGWRKALG